MNKWIVTWKDQQGNKGSSQLFSRQGAIVQAQAWVQQGNFQRVRVHKVGVTATYKIKTPDILVKV